MAKMYNNDAPGLKSLTRIKSPPTIWLRVTRGCTKSTGPLITFPPPKCGAKFFPRLPLNLASSPPSQNESQSSTAHLSSLEPAPPDTIKTRSKPPKIEVNPQIYSSILVWTLIISPPHPDICTCIFISPQNICGVRTHFRHQAGKSCIE